MLKKGLIVIIKASQEGKGFFITWRANKNIGHHSERDTED